ncbi:MULTISPECIES: putative 2-dehydropantoate 2-reductase [Pseudomonas]|jgi:2-dehydropantoate 2-reductase|uniref:2-dehydropantoate 2-reductase n=1 Tax=Pseudomonas rhodesiae TaxID=76760 RepID=A0A8I1E9J3_9PSED|nr:MULTISPECIES: putative 2-dehydropantoate 2-reductase [Pseudomonas]MBB4815109.1 2-dehydropantoate 2-reductase [Pseudomonas rhodesiae]MBI6603476.1 putative 2-dehydropantoate 2-reductase [Pseudomonas sp. S4_EA_1b]MBI6627255.1 putative 2-dehydropantoate 2-reductase [Pseudomonas rhodesiae]MDN6864708.1 putative 2-dehydropantoate 2-reductase [Pseudomonas rhodesiae]NMY80001.1 putative 2-dehydropantoate 2-reductase [Pseudomonas rhodesiae]
MTTVTPQSPRIGIIGTGAIGGFYGLMLARAGFDVHFLLRSEYAVVSEQGLRVNSGVHGALHLHPVQAYAQAADMPPCDWLLVGTKSTGNVELAPTLAQVAAPDAKVVLLQNGLDVEDSLREHLPASLHLLGGLCYIGVHRSGPGVVEHQALGRVNLGYHSGSAANDENRQKEIVEAGAALFHKAGIESQAMANVHQARWHKLVWNVPFNGLSVLLKAGTTNLMADASSRELIQALMAEVIQGAHACGHEIPASYAEQMFAMTETMEDYLPSMYHDYMHKRPLELAAIYARPLSAAKAAGCELPRMQALHQALSFIDRHNR